MRRRPSSRDWTALEYVVAGIALMMCLVNLLR
jgi:hypothetical protein